MHGQVAAHRVGSEVVELNTAQSQAAGNDPKGIQWSAGKSRFQCCTSNGCCSCRGASRIGDGVAGVGRLELEIELERIVFPEVR